MCGTMFYSYWSESLPHAVVGRFVMIYAPPIYEFCIIISVVQYLVFVIGIDYIIYIAMAFELGWLLCRKFASQDLQAS
jgi:hypothetical protein